MTVTVAAFADVTCGDRVFPRAGKAGSQLVRCLLLGTAAAATVGVGAVGVALMAGWLVSGSLSARGGSSRADFGLRGLALVPSNPDAIEQSRPADVIVVTPSFAEAAMPVRVAERKLPPHTSARTSMRPNEVPIPPTLPPALASERDAKRREVASLTQPLPRAAPKVVGTPPTAHADKPASVQAPDSRTAVYDIAEHAVYLPNGRTLEAHSGLGEWRDDPRYVGLKDRGPTPPNTYDLSLREELFHGVRAIRLTPVNDQKMFGRAGMLAHTYMLGPQGDSNGCVSFKDYQAFLQAYLRGDVDRLVVVSQRGEVATPVARRDSARGIRYAANETGPASLSYSLAER